MVVGPEEIVPVPVEQENAVKKGGRQHNFDRLQRAQLDVSHERDEDFGDDEFDDFKNDFENEEQEAPRKLEGLFLYDLVILVEHFGSPEKIDQHQDFVAKQDDKEHEQEGLWHEFGPNVGQVERLERVRVQLEVRVDALVGIHLHVHFDQAQHERLLVPDAKSQSELFQRVELVLYVHNFLEIGFQLLD